MMKQRQTREQRWAGLLALLLLGSIWGPVFARLRPAAGGCAAAPAACCCAKSGLATCACDGHAGTAAQLAALSSCSSAGDLPTFLVSPPPATLTRTGVALPLLRLCGTAPVLHSDAVPCAAPAPPSPPPQAA